IGGISTRRSKNFPRRSVLTRATGISALSPIFISSGCKRFCRAATFRRIRLGRNSRMFWVAPFKIQGASDFAKASYGEALKRFPFNPEAYLAQARVSLLDGNSKDARDFLLKAAEVKRDYAPAHFLLAQLEASSGNLSEAIRRAESTVLLVPNHIGALFQLGLLYYKNKNFSDARIVL